MAAIPLSTQQQQPIDLDRRALRARAERFRWHHRERYLAALAKLSEAGRDVVATLPALFHLNHVTLPGYVADTPFGLPGYTPDSITKAALRRIAPGTELRSLRQQTDLQAVFLMGSGGSIGHTGDSDIDLWVCCEATHHTALRPKLEALTAWAGSLGVQLQGFLVDPCFFEDPNDHVHDAMLLDEFYRSGIWLGGNEPVWWFVDGAPADTYRQTAAQLVHYRFIDHVIDFGPVQRPSTNALAAAAGREIEAARFTPYKSLMKLALLECYLDEPHNPLLSQRYQQLIVAGESDASRLDTYAMLYEHLEEYGSGSFTVADARDLFVRRILPRARLFSSHNNLQQRLQGWGYDEAQLDTIRHPQRAGLHRALAEYDKTQSLLRRGVTAARRLGAEPSWSIDALQRRPLRALDPALRSNVHASLTLSLHQGRWRLAEDEHVIVQADTYVEPLVWLWLQRFEQVSVRYATPWLERASQRLVSALDAQCATLFLNPLPNPMEDVGTLLSAQDDPLSYGGMATNLLRQAAVVTHDGQDARVTLHNTPQLAIAAVRDLAVGDLPVRVCAADIEDMRLVRRIDALLTAARDAFSHGQSLEVPFGRTSAVLHPANAASGVHIAA